MKTTQPDPSQSAPAAGPASPSDNLTPDAAPLDPGQSAAPSEDSSQLQSQIAELAADLQRTRADFENYRKQIESQKAQSMAAARRDTIIRFLDLIDDFDRALQTYPEQLAPLAKSFHKTLDSLDLKLINTDVDTEFNPDFHEAVSVADGEGDVEVIAETLRPGYIYAGKVVRPAMVKVKYLANQ